MWLMRRTPALLAAAGLLVTIVPPLPGATTETVPGLEQEVRTLLEKLSAPTRAERDEAEKRLVERGPKVLPLLPPPELLPSPSVREAVRRIRFELERTAARESVLPSKVTLSGTESTAAALREVSRQSGNRLDGRLLGDARLRRPVGAAAKAVSFWPLLDDLAARHHWRYEYDSSGRGFKLVPLETGSQLPEPAVAYSGAFRVQALPAERIPRGAGRVGAKKEDEPSGPAFDLLRVALEIMPEPRLRPLFLQIAMSEMTARA